MKLRLTLSAITRPRHMMLIVILVVVNVIQQEPRVATLQLISNSLHFPCVFPVLLPFSLCFFVNKK